MPPIKSKDPCMRSHMEQTHPRAVFKSRFCKRKHDRIRTIFCCNRPTADNKNGQTFSRSGPSQDNESLSPWPNPLHTHHLTLASPRRNQTSRAVITQYSPLNATKANTKATSRLLFVFGTLRSNLQTIGASASNNIKKSLSVLHFINVYMKMVAMCGICLGKELGLFSQG